MTEDLDLELEPDEPTPEEILDHVAYALTRARQLRAIWSRKAQEHMERCAVPARDCKRCRALANFLSGLTRMLHVFEDGDWGG